MAVASTDDYAACRTATHQAKSNFAAGMRLFPAGCRDAIYAMYAFFRHTDDIVDGTAEPEAKREALAAWQAAVAAAVESGGEGCSGPLAAVGDTARRCGLPRSIFDDCISACAGDVGTVRIRTWGQLLGYCDGVAGTVGEACLRILGYDDAPVLALARRNARAVQVTNVLRDVAEDLALDRVYLPDEILARHGVDAAALALRPWPAGVAAVLDEVAARAEAEYEGAEALFHLLAPDRRPGVVAMTLRYRLLLERLRADGFPIRDGRARLDGSCRARLLLAAQLSRWMPTWRLSPS